MGRFLKLKILHNLSTAARLFLELPIVNLKKWGRGEGEGERERGKGDTRLCRSQKVKREKKKARIQKRENFSQAGLMGVTRGKGGCYRSNIIAAVRTLPADKNLF